MNIVEVLQDIRALAFDTAPIIYFIEKNVVYFPKMQAVMQRVAAGQINGVAASLALTEVLVQPIKTGNTALAGEYQDILLYSGNFRTVAMNDTVARRAAELRAGYNLKTPDAIHVATALVSGCDAFLCNDTGIQRVTEINVLLLDDLHL